MNNELIERYNKLIEVLTAGLDKAELAAENARLKDKVEELADLVSEQDERILELEAILYQHNIPFDREV
ncbi:MAG: hypothetical protein D6732_26090 [Methanobacteriota archaeon]|nr:MAG: hypothetical protein D6732_26090 [Euryarchaeota archaeon]